MITCDTCRAPGNCCSGFTLNIVIKGDDWKQSAADLMEQYGMPFIVPVSRRIDAELGDFNNVLFSCQRLGADGRCTQYDDRPNLCRTYQAGDDALCAEFVQTFKGIPVRVVAP